MVTTAALVSGLVAGVTLYYLGSPCLVRPHPLVTANISAVVARGMAEDGVARDTEDGEAILLENWTRWRLELGTEQGTQLTVPPHSAVSLAPRVRIELPQNILVLGSCWTSPHADVSFVPLIAHKKLPPILELRFQQFP